MLTVHGDAFAARVAASLYASLSVRSTDSGSDSSGGFASASVSAGNEFTRDLERLLVLSSLKELEDQCVRMFTASRASKPAPVSLTQLLSRHISLAAEANVGFCNGNENVYLLLHCLEVLYEVHRDVHQQRSSMYHIYISLNRQSK